MHPWKAILSRWRDILLYGAIAPIAAIPLGVLVSQAIDALLSGIAPELSNLATLLRYSCFSLLFAMVWWQSGTRVSHYRLIHRYPPALTHA